MVRQDYQRRTANSGPSGRGKARILQNGVRSYKEIGAIKQ